MDDLFWANAVLSLVLILLILFYIGYLWRYRKKGSMFDKPKTSPPTPEEMALDLQRIEEVRNRSRWPTALERRRESSTQQ